MLIVKIFSLIVICATLNRRREKRQVPCFGCSEGKKNISDVPNLNSCYWVNCPFKEIEWKWKGKKTQSFVAIDWLSAWDNLIDICGRSLMIHSSTAEHKLMWKVFTACTWISLFTNIQVIIVWLRFTIHWWVCFLIFMTYGSCFIVILYCWKKMKIFWSINNYFQLYVLRIFGLEFRLYNMD